MFLLLRLSVSQAQGLVPSKPRLGADSTYKSAYDRFRQQWQGSRSWQSAFKSAPQRACSRGGASTTLCSSAAGAAAADDKFAQLLLATSPARFFSVPIYAFAALNGWKLQDYYARQNPVLLAPGNQGSCQTCTAFTVAAAAEAAVAATLDRSAQEVGRLSVQDLAFCSEAGLRPCSSGWTLEGALSRLKDGRPLKLDQCLKVRGRVWAAVGWGGSWPRHAVVMSVRSYGGGRAGNGERGGRQQARGSD
ncbi:hypothetical protein MNEG_3207 [Monoraphidium neglectum]|uniref:Peptidase C1A papain C-terminal domain-containing protein n=1 Tax=Monoraphidium neglectum TaxID=145388 RepID=A0A0D2MQ14_9CHLO|nr:hypothetical protein MNEG_3207 [Monoraphidium neglectum]KIZ04750.1 hypothetical protein MNEG_3207 [Monoraphidium neglectum]|eukprot:XP_013903769.1 hypothetical protein MNEG_3207 [Monoraphidium neglectum]